MEAQNKGKPGHTGLKRIIKAAGFSMQGFKAAFKHEAAVRQELMLFLVAAPIALLIPVTVIEKILLVASLLIILIVELLNSAVEAVVDRIGPEHNELSGRAKDIGSAAVFVALLLSAFVWGMIVVDNFLL